MFRSCCAGRWVGLISFGAWGQTVNRSHPLKTSPGQKSVGEPPNWWGFVHGQYETHSCTQKTKVELANPSPPPKGSYHGIGTWNLAPCIKKAKRPGFPQAINKKFPTHIAVQDGQTQRPCLHKATQAALYSLLLRPVQLSSVTRTCDPSIHLIFSPIFTIISIKAECAMKRGDESLHSQRCPVSA